MGSRVGSGPGLVLQDETASLQNETRVPPHAWHMGQLGHEFRSAWEVYVWGPCPRPGRTVSPSWEDQTPPPSWPLLPTLWSSPPAGVWGRKGMSHPEGGSTPTDPPGQVRSQGFLQEERKLEQEEEPPGGWGAARPSGAAGVSSWAAGASSGAAGGLAGQQGRPAGPLPPGPKLRPCAGLTCVSVRLRRLQ